MRQNEITSAIDNPAMVKFIAEHEANKSDGSTIGQRFVDRYLGKSNLLVTILAMKQDEEDIKRIIANWLERSGYRNYLPTPLRT